VGGAVAGQFAVPGARLYTETRGAGPLLLLVVGGNGDPGVFFGVADRLAGDFTVVTYARRGFARSPVDSPVDDAGRIGADAGDAAALIAGHGGGPAHATPPPRIRSTAASSSALPSSITGRTRTGGPAEAAGGPCRGR
jgi:pimeloyl-ACP methyl ester carboxylesterase